MIISGRLVLLGLSLLSACASRSASTTHSDGAPASLKARPAPRAEVTRALDGEPPAPGQDASGWLGLRTPGAAPAAHDHAQHAMPGAEPAYGAATADPHAGHGDPPVGQADRVPHDPHAGHVAHAPRDAEAGHAQHDAHADHGDHARHDASAPHALPARPDAGAPPAKHDDHAGHGHGVQHEEHTHGAH